MSDALDSEADLGPSIYAAQRAQLPRAWAAIDRVIVATTRGVLFAIGALFCIFIFLEVFSRYLFSFSIFFVNAGAGMLVPWFFFLGAGLALRDGSHIGITILIDLLPNGLRKAMIFLGGLMSAAFLTLVFVSASVMLGPGLQQIEPSLGISLFWGFLSLPLSFGLLAYHLVTQTYVTLTAPPAREGAAS